MTEIVDEFDNDCIICGDSLDNKYSITLVCNHKCHYECIMKSFMTGRTHNSNNKLLSCPYCRKQCDYLPFINGLKKVIPGIHYNKYDYNIKKLLNNQVKNQVKCKYIFKKGKKKDTECGKFCQLGYEYCSVHNKKYLKQESKDLLNE
tara:strand:- start:434 stop:874 length:441 start_codon:yes stop_codon:yes gene_type:complete